MGAMLALLTVVILPSVDKSRITGTEAAVRQLATSVRQFRMDCGRLPTVEEGLQVLIHRPRDWPPTMPWAPYLETTRIPRDDWGRQFIYVLDPELAEGFGIYSCGHDGVSSSNGNDRDDLNTWSERRPWLAYYASPWRRKNLRSTLLLLGVIALTATVVVVLAGRAVPTRR